MSSDEVVRAAGGIVHRHDPDGTWRLLVVHRPRYDDWSLPKGKADPGERDEDTACREVHEETGLRCGLGDEVGSTQYRDARGRAKTVRYWMMEPHDADLALDFVPNDEVDALRWCTPHEAVQLLTYAHDRGLIRHLDPLPR